MICNSNFHDKNCPSYRNNALKSASAITNNNNNNNYSPTTTKKLFFNDKEVQLISKVIELSRYYVKDLQNQDIMLKLNQCLKILHNQSNINKLRGASACERTKYEPLTIRNLIRLS